MADDTLLTDRVVLLPIDVQQAFDLPSWGSRNNPGMEATGLSLVAAWRAAGLPVIHVKHNSTAAASTLRPGQPGNAFKTGFEPQPGETVVEKSVNAAFIGTSLEANLRSRGLSQIVTFGITTDMCVSTTVRVGANLGFDMIVVADACATFDQTAPDGGTVAAEMLHRVHLTTLNTEFARVINAGEVFAALR